MTDDHHPSLLIVATVMRTVRSFLIPYATHFRELGWRVDVAANGASTDPVVSEAFDGVRDIPLSRSLKDLRGMVAAYRELETVVRGGYDIVHVHTPIASFLTRAAVHRMDERTRPQLAYTAHGFHFHARGSRISNGAFVTAERVAGRWTDRLVVINNEDRGAAERYRLVPPSRLVYMPGIGIDTQRYSRASLDPSELDLARTDLGIDAATPLFVVVAELSRRKRPLDVVAALSAMASPGAHVVFLGDGPERTAVEEAVRQAGLTDRVHLRGEVSDVRPVVACASALVLASSREGLPRSIMEALAMEVPVIASDARGNADLVLPDAGHIVPAGSVPKLAAAMDKIVADPDAARAMGKAGRERMVQTYDIGMLLQRHEHLYHSMLSGADRS
jgi:glycosyltransferase involved in cell wall biosynthesis